MLQYESVDEERKYGIRRPILEQRDVIYFQGFLHINISSLNRILYVQPSGRKIYQKRERLLDYAETSRYCLYGCTQNR